VNSLRARDKDVEVHVKANANRFSGPSVGILAALCFMQLMTDCSYIKVSTLMLF
jgi:hypothetical protein